MLKGFKFNFLARFKSANVVSGWYTHSTAMQQWTCYYSRATSAIQWTPTEQLMEIDSAIGKPNILIVDDHPSNLRAMKNILCNLPANLFFANSANDGLTILLSRPFALALIDVQMPDMNGFEMASLIRESEDTKTLPIIFVTAISKQDDYIHEGYDSGAVDYLSKPINPHILLSKVGIFLDLHNEIEKRRQAEKLKDEFVSIVSHELRSPLTTISGTLYLLAGGVLTDLDDNAKSMVESAIRNCKHCINLVNDLLDIQKIEQGSFTMELTKSPIIAVIEDAIAWSEGVRDKYNVSFVLEQPAYETTIAIDRNRIIQVVMNLLSNAAKFSTSGAKVTIQVLKVNKMVRISVKDTGPGIPEDFQPLIFRKFAQANDSHKNERGGSGLGLAISKSIVEQHGGTIGYDTKTDVGTTFYIDLPDVT